MTEKLPAPKRSLLGAERPLLDRVEQRVRNADEALARREKAVRPRVRRRPTRRSIPVVADSPPVVSITREVRALRMVFSDLGQVHRRYRLRTGEGVTPALRAATHAFKQAPSLVALVLVAEFFADLDLLEW